MKLKTRLARSASGTERFFCSTEQKNVLGSGPPWMAEDMSAAGRSLMGYTIETLLVNFIILIFTYDKNDIDKHRSRSGRKRARYSSCGLVRVCGRRIRSIRLQRHGAHLQRNGRELVSRRRTSRQLCWYILARQARDEMDERLGSGQCGRMGEPSLLERMDRQRVERQERRIGFRVALQDKMDRGLRRGLHTASRRRLLHLGTV